MRSTAAGAVAAALAACSAAGAAEAGTPAVVTGPVAHAAGTAGSVSAYWTPARMREAIRNSGESQGSTLAWGARAASAAPAPALPGLKAIGRVFSVKPDGTPWSCSGTLIDSPTRSVVWTAGHCIHTGRRGAFHSNLAFAPGYQPQATGAPMPYGIWAAAYSAAAGSWVFKGSTRANDVRNWKVAQYDMAGLVLVRDPTGRPAGDVVGATQHIRFRVRRSRQVRMIGYPVAPPALGEQLMQCGPARLRRPRWAINLLAMPCPLGNGMSGGPALSRLNAAGVGTVIGEMTLTDHRRMYVAFQGRESRRLYRYLAKLRN